VLRERQARREAEFLQTIRRLRDLDPTGPYARLLDHAGCAYGDVVRLVHLMILAE
jgi:hypothetical protein